MKAILRRLSLSKSKKFSNADSEVVAATPEAAVKVAATTDPAATTEVPPTSNLGPEVEEDKVVSDDAKETDTKETETSGVKEIDLVFCVDCTGSMGSYIKAAQDNVIKICQDLVAGEKADLRFALVSYRDHPPQDSTYITKVHKFTDSFRTMQGYCRTMSAAGGGDGPEAVTAALHEALHLDYRKNATKFCILIADAPPHGIGESGDGFPNGDPDGKDPIQIAHNMLENGITLYVAACEPSVSLSYTYAADFFLGIAKITEGKCLPLTSANLLADVIVGGAAEEASLEALMAVMEEEAKKVQKEREEKKLARLSESALELEVAQRFQKRNVMSKKCAVDDVGYASRDMYNASAMCGSKSMFEARAKWKTPTKTKGFSDLFSAPRSRSSSRSRSRSSTAAPMSAYGATAPLSMSAAPQKCHRSESVIDTEQVSRMMKKCKARKKGMVW